MTNDPQRPSKPARSTRWWTSPNLTENLVGTILVMLPIVSVNAALKLLGSLVQ